MPSSPDSSPSRNNQINANTAHMTHQINPLRALQSQDSMSREWDAALHAGDDGMISLLQGQAAGGSGFYDIFRSLNQATPSSSSQQTLASGSNSQQFSFDPDTAFDNSQPTIPTLLSDLNPTDRTPGMRNLPPVPLNGGGGGGAGYPEQNQGHVMGYGQSISPAQLNMGVGTGGFHDGTGFIGGVGGSLYQHAQAASTTGQTKFNVSDVDPRFGEYRPGSAASSYHSHHSHSASASAAASGQGSTSASGSEYDYSATDVSEQEDFDMALANVGLAGIGGTGTGGDGGAGLSTLDLRRLGLKGEKTWTQYDQDTGGPSGAATVGAGGGGLRGMAAGGVGPIRKSGARGEEEKQGKDKLEHRRSINRKSAQKHRARRKEELEVLTLAIADRDARISALERDLAVEKAKSAQLMEFMKAGQGSISPPIGGGGGGGGVAAGGLPSPAPTSAASEGEAGKKTQMPRRTSSRNKKEGNGGGGQGGSGVRVFGDGRDAGW